MLKQRDAPAKRTPTGSVERGTGSGEYKVKGKRASAKQRQVIDGCLAQCREDGASRRVMIADIMCITQESNCGELANVMTGDDDVGIYQQGRPWISLAGSKQPGPSTHAFLITGPSSWKKVHGSVKKAPGNLSHAIHAVQNNKNPNDYAQWEDEATRTVDSWLDNGGSEGGSGSSPAYAKSYAFTRGEKGGQREDSWDAMARLMGDVNGYRWAAANTLFAVSGDELRAGGPRLTIYGDEGWLQQQPAWSWASGRSISEITLQALAGRWDVMPGGIVSLHRRFGAMQGKWMVWNVSGSSLTSPEVTIVLRRPTRLKSEPPHEMAGGSESGSGGSGSLYEACKKISDEKHSYPHPDVHHGPWKNIKRNTTLDCSESVSLALHMAGLFGDRKQAIVSGQFGSWGKAGKGDEWAVWYNDGHVWIEGYGDDGKFDWRFDTSHHSESGPRLVRTARNDQARFKARHAG